MVLIAEKINTQGVYNQVHQQQQPVKVNLSELPPGYVWQGRYVIVKALEKGSGGSVYLVNDISMSQCESHLLKEEMVQHKSPVNEFMPSN